MRRENKRLALLNPGQVFSALLIAVTLLGWPEWAPATVAEDLPDARLQLILHSIKLFDDHDWGDGDIAITIFIEECFGDNQRGCKPSDAAPALVHATIKFSGSDDDPDIQLERVVPKTGDVILGGTDSEASGFAVYPNHRYIIYGIIQDEDTFIDDELGEFNKVLDGRENWGIGTYATNGYLADEQRSGDYYLSYEIRRAPLPDLRPIAIENPKLVGSTDDVVCMTVVNDGVKDAGSFQMALRIDDVPARNSIVEAGNLPPGQKGALCTNTDLPKQGQHKLSVTVDERQIVKEQSETNNFYEQPFIVARIAGVGSTIAEPLTVSSETGTASNPPPVTFNKPDLSVSSITIKSKDSSDCDPGKNEVTVTITNTGSGDADQFAVRLFVDDDDKAAEEERVKSLDAGKSTEVHFNNVKLDKGDHTLTALADAKTESPESEEDNNTRKVTVICKDKS